MLAITPLAINCLMMSIGLVAMRSASSRTVMLAGISMTLWPFSLMTSLRQGAAERGARSEDQTLIARLGADAGSLARGIDLYPVRTAHDPDQRSLRQHVPAPYAGPLRLPFRPPGRHAMSFLVRGFRPTRR